MTGPEIIEDPDDTIVRLATRLRDLEAAHGDLVEQVQLNAPESFDDDRAPESICVDYVRWLEAENERLRKAGTAVLAEISRNAQNYRAVAERWEAALEPSPAAPPGDLSHA